MPIVFNDAFRDFVKRRVSQAEIAAETSDRGRELVIKTSEAYCKLEPVLYRDANGEDGPMLYEAAKKACTDLWEEFCNASYLQGFKDAIRILSS